MAALADPRASRVVMIGGALYDHLPPVPAVVRNLTGLRQVFTDPDLWGLEGRNCRTVLDSTDPVSVGRTVREATAEVQPDGLLLVYYAGHGLIDPYDGTLLLALRGTEPAVPHEAALPYEFIRRAVAASAARRRVVILDCCYAGRATGELAAEGTGTETVADRAEIDQTCLLVSAPRNGTAQAPPGEPYTAFTGELLRTLRGGLPDEPAVLDVGAVWQQVRQALRSRGFELPHLRAADSGQSIGLVRNAARHRRDLIGHILVAAPHVTDRDLHQAAVLVLRHDRTKGAIGVRINGPTSPLPGEIPLPWRQLLAEPPLLFHGGPLSGGDGFIAVAVLRPQHTPPVRFRAVRDRLGIIALSADPAALRHRFTGMRLFTGYLGWGPEQLEADLDSGDLIRTDHPYSAVLSGRPDQLWTILQRRT